MTARALRSDRRRSESSEEKAPKSTRKAKDFPSRGGRRGLSSPPFVSLTRTRADGRRARWPVPPLPPSPPRARRRATRPASAREPRAVAADSLPATATTPPRSAPPREIAPFARVFLAPVEDAPHSEHAVSFLLDHLAREGDVVHLLVVVPATHPPRARWRTEARWYRASPNRRGRARSRRSFFSRFSRGATVGTFCETSPHNAKFLLVAR